MRQEMRQAVDFLYEIPKFTEKNSLSHTKELMRLLGSPAKDRKVIHVAGSNGKGSVCSFLSAMLLAGGASVGMFTSPHLTDIRERFRINGKLCSEEMFLQSFYRVKEAVDELKKKNLSHPTFFEFIFAMGMVIFETARVEYVVLETGLGGRLDATNSFPSPVLSVITSISLEHTEYLGDTVEQIAAEKAGILKPGVPVVYDGEDVRAAGVIRARADQLHCPSCPVTDNMYKINGFKNNLIDFSLHTDYDKGTGWELAASAPYQVKNAAISVTAMRMMQDIRQNKAFTDEVLRRGLRQTRWRGRMQEARPGIWLDGAHNTAGIRAFAGAVRLLTGEDRDEPLLLFSMVRDKDFRASIRFLAEETSWDRIAVTTIPGERGIPFQELQREFEKYTDRPVSGYADYREALQEIQKNRKDGQKLFCTGSLYFIGALLSTEELKEENDD